MINKFYILEYVLISQKLEKKKEGKTVQEPKLLLLPE